MKEILLTQGKVALVDDADYERVNRYKWYAWRRRNNKWYAIRSDPAHRGGSIFMHRFIMDAPSTFQVDHKNGNGLDNRRDNLRLCNNSQNHCNIPKGARNTSGYKGVTWHKHKQRWQAQIQVKGSKNRYLGLFDTAIEAARAYDTAAKTLHGEFAHLNLESQKR